MSRAHGIQEAGEATQVFPLQSPEGARVRGLERRVELHEDCEARFRDEAENLAPIARASEAAHEALGLQAVEEPRDPGGLLDHALGDLEGGKAARSGAAEDPEDVVLLQREAEGLDDPGEMASHEIRGAEEA
jgi:hypothetical protein